MPYRSMSAAIRDDDNVKHAFDLIKIKSRNYMYTVPPYGRTSCDYIVEVTILS